MSQQTTKNLRYALPKLPDVVDSSIVNSLTDYVILEHLTRRLTAIDDRGVVIGDLAASWAVSENFEQFTFRLKEHQTFSDGASIKAADVVESFERSLRLRNAVHFDFSSISGIKGVSDFEVQIILEAPNPNFLVSLGHPEFAALSKDDRMADLGQQTFRCSSGVYSLGSRGQGIIRMHRNLPTGGEVLEFYESGLLGTRHLASSDIDVFWGPTDPSFELHQEILASGYQAVEIPIAFTSLLTLNPLHPAMRELSQRKLVQNSLRRLVPALELTSPSLRPTEHIYFGTGPGRVSPEVIEKAYDLSPALPLPRPTILRILLSSEFKHTFQVASCLESLGFQIEIETYGDFSEYAQLIIDRSKFALIEVNNDFSSVDLTDSIFVTFNPARPLVILPEGDSVLPLLLGQLKTTSEEPSKHALISDIGVRLIADGLVAPLFHQPLLAYVNKRWDAGAWSRHVPEVSAWKLRPTSP